MNNTFTLFSATYNHEPGYTGVEGEQNVDITSESGISQTQDTKQLEDKQIVIEGLDSGTVIGIAFAAFIIGVLMMGILWFIHTHSGSSKWALYFYAPATKWGGAYSFTLVCMSVRHTL